MLRQQLGERFTKTPRQPQPAPDALRNWRAAWPPAPVQQKAVAMRLFLCVFDAAPARVDGKICSLPRILSPMPVSVHSRMRALQ